MFDVMVRPTLPRLSDAPITAIDFGDKKTDSAMLTNLDQKIFHNKVNHKFLISKVNFQASFLQDFRFLEPKQFLI